MNTGPRAATRFQLAALRALVDGQEVAYGVTLHSLIKRRLVERGRGKGYTVNAAGYDTLRTGFLPLVVR